MNDQHRVAMVVNGIRYEVDVESRRLLVDVLRHDLRLTGTHVGCEHGVCGACTVIVDGALTRSCLSFAVQHDGADIETVEGLSDGETLSELQRVFAEKAALQCGFCTAGFLMLAKAFIARESRVTQNEVRELVSSNLCRCTGYQQINEAVRELAARVESGEPAEGGTPADEGDLGCG
jgi:aerobic-type carbon monoxide dehydrogenase small subunit (CoxS/CutS family)